MAAGESRGGSIHARISRWPMAVRVLSSTHSRLPFFSLERSVSVSSRLRRAVRSSSMNCPVVKYVRVERWDRSVFWVS